MPGTPPLNRPESLLSEVVEIRPKARAAPDWPSFSIVIPTYQRRDVVSDAVRALAKLDYDGRLELVVVVDGSTDGTAEALRRIESPFPVRVIEQPNGGAADARNRGAAEAGNDVILFLDDDMICEPNLVREHARLHLDGADAAIGDTPIDSQSPQGFLPQSIGRWIATKAVQSPLSPFDIFTGQLSVRRSLFQKIGGFDTSFTTGTVFGNEDSDFGVRLLAGHDVRHNPAAVSRQRYVVSAREYMERVPAAVAAHLRFISKHPDLAWQLVEARGWSKPVTRFLYRPLTRLPLVPQLLSKVAVMAAEMAPMTRFGSSRVLARFFSGACSIAYWSALRRAGWFPGSNRLLVLCYHAIADQSGDPVLAPYGVCPSLFADQLDSLKRRGFSFVSPGALAAFLSSNAPLPRRAVLLTFDDCYSSLLAIARDVLQPRGIEALAFAVTGPATNEWDQAYGAQRLELLKPEELADLGSLGMEIGSHSRTHREMPLLSPEDRAAEATGSLDDLARKGLPRPRFFAYPYAAFDSATKRTVVEAGYLAAFGLAQRRLTRRADRFELPRVIILASDRGWRFRLKTAAPRVHWWLSRVSNGLRRRLAGMANAGE